jgi:radical SAM protein with 4Fe4S-binding SPASM domain
MYTVRDEKDIALVEGMSFYDSVKYFFNLIDYVSKDTNNLIICSDYAIYRNKDKSVMLTFREDSRDFFRHLCLRRVKQTVRGVVGCGRNYSLFNKQYKIHKSSFKDYLSEGNCHFYNAVVNDLGFELKQDPECNDCQYLNVCKGGFICLREIDQTNRILKKDIHMCDFFKKGLYDEVCKKYTVTLI